MKTVIITGASFGIGEACAKSLTAAGFNVLLTARSLDRLEKIAADINASSATGKAIAIQADVTSHEDMKQAAQRALDEYGRLDILVNNAGIMPLSYMKNLHVDEWSRMIDVNIKGVLHSIASVLPTFMQQNSGHIINISSVAGTTTFKSGTVYCATKYAVEAITQGIRAELSKSDNIRVTSVRPGPTTTNLLSTVTDPDVRSWLDAPSDGGGQALYAEDVARAVVYAASQPEHASVTELTIRPTSDD